MTKRDFILRGSCFCEKYILDGHDIIHRSPEGRAAKQVQYNMLRHARGPTASSKFALLHRPTKNNIDNKRDM